MPSNRMQRINEDIQRELASILNTVRDPRVSSGLVSVTHTDTSSDLGYCTVFVSVLGQEDDKQILKGLKSATGYIRGELSRRLNYRHTPELTFELDKSIAYGAHISKLLNELEVKHDDE